MNLTPEEILRAKTKGIVNIAEGSAAHKAIISAMTYYAKQETASFADVKRIWNAAENYTLHELGEICKGDAAYCEDVPDLENYFERHWH